MTGSPETDWWMWEMACPFLTTAMCAQGPEGTVEITVVHAGQRGETAGAEGRGHSEDWGWNYMSSRWRGIGRRVPRPYWSRLQRQVHHLTSPR